MKASAAISTEFIRRIPKTDLHVHLDGSLRLPTLIELAQQQRVRLPSYTEEGLRRLVFKDRYANLPEYLKGFAYTCAVMQDVESLERIAFELAEDNLAEGVRYLEVRFAPQLHVHDRLPMENVVRAVVRGLERAQQRHNRTAAVRQGDDVTFFFRCDCYALRFVEPTMWDYYWHSWAVMPSARTKQVAAAASLELARSAVRLVRRRGLPIVRFDLAETGAGYSAEDHQAAFQYAHSHFLREAVPDG
ncbi:MAG: hypothetical protein N3A53_06645 [Verrucomicrobiae bacterium]|nr:hypothetical protein [Verrucomicrobiae bacterium]